MPYVIKKVSDPTYKVFKGKKSFSKKGLSLSKAKKQKIAIILSELGLSKKQKK